MADKRKDFVKSWDKRINFQKRRYFPERIFGPTNDTSLELRTVLSNIKYDLVFVYRQLIASLKQLKAFGKIIRKNYNLGLATQLYRLLYTGLVVRVNVHQYRKRLLFKTESWNYVKLYDYGQTHTQFKLAKCSFPDEIPVIEDKFRFYKYCKEKEIRTPEVLAVFSKGRQIYPENFTTEFPEVDLFIKDTIGGKGVRAKKLTFHKKFYEGSGGEKFTKQELRSYIINYSIRNDVMIQRNLVNHALFKPFTSGGLSTCRIVTVKAPDSGFIKPLFAVLRMPVGNTDVDNYAQGGLLSTINIDTGVLGKAVTYVPCKNKFEFDVHPDTNHHISGTRLPLWKDMLSFTLESHRKFRSLAVGWDVCFSSNGICLIEGNIRWGSSLYECPEQLPFRDTEYPEIYEKLIAKYSRYE